jgi:hypothetical protein
MKRKQTIGGGMNAFVLKGIFQIYNLKARIIANRECHSVWKTASACLNSLNIMKTSWAEQVNMKQFLQIIL